jgi:hypothetical protein
MGSMIFGPHIRTRLGGVGLGVLLSIWKDPCQLCRTLADKPLGISNTSPRSKSFFGEGDAPLFGSEKFN